jgi:hypothetical protein
VSSSASRSVVPIRRSRLHPHLSKLRDIMELSSGRPSLIKKNDDPVIFESL